MAHKSALILADLALILVVGALLKPLLRRLRQPAVIAEILAGIALGPSLLGLLPWHLPDRLFPQEARADLSAVAQVGILLFMFLIGWEADLGQIRTRRTEVLGVSLSAITVPFGVGAVLATWLFTHHDLVGQHHISRTAFVLFVGTAMAITAFPVLARIIVDHNLQTTTVGVLALASAAVGDLLAWCMLAFVSVVAASAGTGQLVSVLGYSLLFAAVLAFVVRPLLRVLTARMTRNGTVSPYLLPLIAAGVFAAGYTTNRIGLDAIFGAFAFGLITPRGPKELLYARVAVPVKHVTDLLMPVFFITTGLSVDVTRLGGTGLVELVAIVAVACFGKLAGTVGAARVSGMSWRDSSLLGFLMNTRGLTELIILNAGMSLGVLDTQMFTMMVCMAIITTGMAGFVLPRQGVQRADPGAPALHDRTVASDEQVAVPEVMKTERPVGAGKPDAVVSR
ncbi:cation:proton antiporter [Kitasatospora sp. GP82]|uniref:cation:proton antiporter domain-containing protein n=1 Tax=Kitasatospora sp. GP82 TaxID=3035089 RepID=UPI0024761867|nr:cation:proton antiporter [Kitasatospora sp. GP82]MDH6123906.1 Kef-type K+ transport system membrane component KefB [Kitasatospora sp. GP82]